MASYNKVILLGNLTRDPQLSYTPTQTAIVDFGLAMSRKWVGQDGSQKEETSFVDCRMFGKRAEVINKYLRKGSPIFVEGRLTYESWKAQDGSNRSRLRVTVEEFQFVGGGNSPQGGQGNQQSNQQFASGHNAGSAMDEPVMPMDPFNDDIPF